MNKKLHEMSAQEQAVELTTIVMSDLPASEVIPTLTKRVLEESTAREKYKFIMTQYFQNKLTFDGTKDYNYTELQVDTVNKSPYDDVEIDDMNAGINKGVRDTVHAVSQSNVKTKILSSKLHNFKTNPADSIAEIYRNTENIRKHQEVTMEKEMWTAILDAAFVQDTTGLDSIEINKSIFTLLGRLATTSKVHPQIGTNGVITARTGTVQPSLRFDSNEFIMIVNPLFNTDTVFDGERSFFNWNGSSKQMYAVHELEMDLYEGITDSDRTRLANFKAMLVHKDLIEWVGDWEGSKVFNTPMLFDIIHNFMKRDVYVWKDKPVVIWNEGATLPIGTRAAGLREIIETSATEEGEDNSTDINGEKSEIVVSLETVDTLPQKALKAYADEHTLKRENNKRDTLLDVVKSHLENTIEEVEELEVETAEDLLA